MTDKNMPSIEEVLETPTTKSVQSGIYRAIPFLLVIGLLVVVGIQLLKVQRGPLGSGKAPDFSISSFDGETIKLSDLEGQVVIINFWASWCEPCREEAAYLESVWRNYQDKGVFFIGVDYVDVDAEALAYIEEFDITYFNGPDLGTAISQAYSIQGVPETFFIDKNGIIREVHIGPLYYPALEEKIEELLAIDFQVEND